MLSSLIASKAARLMAFCVCPVVGTGTVVMSVPKVRQAVHRMTEPPHQYALPKTRERLPEAPLALSVPPCPVVGGEGIQTAFVDPGPSQLLASTPPPGGGVPGGTILPLGGGGGGAVPEAGTWLQMIIGFLMLGGSLRLARQRPGSEEMRLMHRAAVLRKGVRQ